MPKIVSRSALGGMEGKKRMEWEMERRGGEGMRGQSDSDFYSSGRLSVALLHMPAA